MRLPIMPAMLLLVAAGLLYVIYQGSEHLVVKPRISKPPAAAPAGEAPEAAEAVDEFALTPECRSIAQAARAAWRAARSGEALETLLRRPVIAWQEDVALRAKLQEVARAIYAAPAANRLREVLRAQHCLPSERAAP